MKLLPFNKQPDQDLVQMLEELVQEAKDGKIGAFIFTHDCVGENAVMRGKHLPEGSNCWKMLGMIEDLKLSFRDWMNQ